MPIDPEVLKQYAALLRGGGDGGSADAESDMIHPNQVYVERARAAAQKNDRAIQDNPTLQPRPIPFQNTAGTRLKALYNQENRPPPPINPLHPNAIVSQVLMAPVAQYLTVADPANVPPHLIPLMPGNDNNDLRPDQKGVGPGSTMGSDYIEPRARFLVGHDENKKPIYGPPGVHVDTNGNPYGNNAGVTPQDVAAHLHRIADEHQRNSDESRRLALLAEDMRDKSPVRSDHAPQILPNDVLQHVVGEDGDPDYNSVVKYPSGADNPGGNPLKVSPDGEAVSVPTEEELPEDYFMRRAVKLRTQLRAEKEKRGVNPNDF